MSDKDTIRDDALSRVTPGIRRMSGGILKICRKLGLGIAVKKTEKPSQEDAERESLIVGWMLDLRQSLDEIRSFPDLPQDVRDQMIAKYEFDQPLALALLVKKEIALTEAELTAVSFSIEPKPEGNTGPSPQGK